MAHRKNRHKKTLTEKYPPSKPCGCDICLGYCARPGWWTVAEAARAVEAGYAPRMMLEMAPDRSFGVLSPAFQGCEGQFALQAYARNGCTFLKEDRCELHGSGFMPLECRFCHHDRPGQGPRCHADLEQDWNSAAGRELVSHWCRLTGFFERMAFFR